MSGDPGSGTQSFEYDDLNRVTQSTGLASGTRTYTYDRSGNRASKTEAGITFTYSHDRTDQLVSVVKTGGTSKSFAYDTFGNLTGDAQTAVSVTLSTYDLGGRLTGLDTGGSATKTTFTLDALGRFRTRTVGTTSPAVDTYSYVGASETVTRISTLAGGSTTITDSLVSPAGERLGVKVGTTVNWFVPDLHGSISGSLTSDESKVSHAIRYDAYGQTIQTGSASGSPTPVGEKPWRYQGRLDVSPIAGAPLYDMSARFYAPGIAAFTQLDSVAGSAQHPLSLNRYLYAEANPATLIDPTGHCTRYQDGVCADHRTGQNTVQKQHSQIVRRAETRRRTIANRRAEHSVESRAARRPTLTNGQIAAARERKAAGNLKLRQINARTGGDTWMVARDRQDDEVAQRERDYAMSSSVDLGGLAHTALDLLGMVPVFGAVADVANAGLYAAEGDFGNAGLSVASVAFDGIGAARLATRFGGKADEAIGGAAGAGDDIGSAGARMGDDALSCPLHSFSPNTRVTTAAGAVAISEIEVGDTVTARDPATGSVAEHTVSAVLVHTDQEIEYLTIDGETIETTPDHRFLTETGWVEAAALYPGTRVVKLDGSTGTVDGYAIEIRAVIMWDLTVSDVHTFAVGEGQWVVHNAGPCNLGKSYPNGTVVADPQIKITGFQGSAGADPFHALNQAISRGVAPRDILATLRSPSAVLQQAGGRYLFLSDQAAVVIRADGQVVTVWSAAEMSSLNRSILAAAAGP